MMNEKSAQEQGLNQKFNLLIALGIMILSAALLLLTERDMGITWDEPAYIAASESYMAWFGELFSQPGYALSAEGIETYWDINHEHPPLNKIWSGAVWAAARPLLPHLTAHRLGNIILSGLLVAMLYWLVADVYGLWPGLAAGALLLTMPRFFFHAHLAALDVPAAVMILATALLFWQTKNNLSWGVDIALGLVWGLAVATKINAVFLLPVFFIWLLLFARRRRLFWRMLVMIGTAVPIFFLTWPWLYRNTITRTIEYIRFLTVDHWQIGQWYLHRFYMPPPWHFPFVITMAVVPILTFLLFFIGSGRVLARAGERPFGSYLLLNALIPLLALSAGQSMVYDNDRLFIAAMPFIAALAAVGLYAIVHWLGSRFQGALRYALASLAFLIVITPPLYSAASLYPHLLSYYSGLVGGVSGADSLGLETTYWCESFNEVLDYLNENAQEGDVVWVDPWSHDVLIYYQLHGRLRDDLSITAPFTVSSILDPQITTVNTPYTQADFVVFQNRKTTLGAAGLDSPLARWLAGRTPQFEFSEDGIPLIVVYHQG